MVNLYEYNYRRNDGPILIVIGTEEFWESYMKELGGSFEVIKKELIPEIELPKRMSTRYYEQS